METLTTNLPELFILLFIAITFLQSGIDKLSDWKGNLSWLKGHFKETFLGKLVPEMLTIVLVIEVLAGLMALGGIYFILADNDPTLAIYASALAALALLMLLFGQRVAKDYAGAFTITGYFMVVIFGLYLLGL